ncbi:GNAT family N-acetyltransferase [Pseudomonas sp. NPDC089547]|uniref:GNAT family N-acetyltransferase n=1 Tax=Pseudomonas sp. NPDC089547 TaxID=3390652 RepID=UPI003D02D1ED
MAIVHSVIESDWRAYREIRLRALRESEDAFASTYEHESTREEGEWQARVSAMVSSSSAQAFFASQHNEVCGLVWCKSSGIEVDVVELFQMWVAPDARGCGVGRALLEHAITWASGRGAQRVRLGVTIAESPAMHLYRASGFHDVGLPEPLREGSALMSQPMELNLGAH